MAKLRLFRHWPVWLLLVVLLVGTGVGLYFLFWKTTSDLPGPDTALYRDYVQAFQVGVAALETNNQEELAQQQLDQAIALIPQEPAGWANRGLLNLRQNKLPEAAQDLKKASDLAPDSGAIEVLLGLLARKQGKLPEAVDHLRKGLEKGADDPMTLFTLAEVISEQGGPDSEAEYQRLLEQILKTEPKNLLVLIYRAGAAFRRNDRAAFQDTLKQLSKLAPRWSAQSRTVLDEVRNAAQEAPAEVVSLLADLDNVLKGERGYTRDVRVIRPQLGFEGLPLQQFLRLHPLRPTPAPPDQELTFTVEPWTTAGLDRSSWDVLQLVWQIGEEQRNALKRAVAGKAAAPVTPAIFLANARAGRLAEAGAPALPFPGGPPSVRPTAACVLALDWNNDFRDDLLLAGAGGLRFWQRRPDGSFQDVTARTGLSKDILGGDYYGAWAADMDMDGDLDVIVARRSGPVLLLRNNGDGTFKALDTFASVPGARGFAWADFDNDGAPDAAFVDSAGRLHIFSNERFGKFEPWPLPGDLGTFLALTAADVNDDGIIDLVALRSDGWLMRLSDQEKRKSWHQAKVVQWPGAKGVPGAVRLFAADLDNNGAVDLIVAGPREAHIFLADEKSEFTALSGAVRLQVCAVLDLNKDGRLDLLGLSTEGRPVQALNAGQKNYHWQAIWALPTIGAGDKRINSFALGGEVEVRSGLVVQKQPITAPVVHFGLGEQEHASIARIVLPNGDAQWEFDLPTNLVFAAEQRLSGSCPFLFTHDGQRIQFVGDFMWGTPLGMYVNGQNTGPNTQTTEWLKIRGDQLQPHDGYYDVRVHANLWETDFFDQLALIVVDHPRGTEIHVDERFFLTPTPPVLHVTTPARPVARAWDHLGADVTDVVAKIDGRYLDHCGRGPFQGVTRDHWVEADLGDDVPKKGPVWLIARGWLHPTDSSINVALSQGQHDQPRPLVLEVPDGKGGWKVGRPALGFPAGKNKTMLIQLDGIEGPGVVSRRFRLRTNMEIFWDFLGYAQGRDAKLAKMQRPAMLAADLHYKGMLAMSRKDRSSPELPNYEKVTRGGQPWRDLTGYHTRFGDVRELLAEVDDRYVIANAGDEIALRFAVPAAPAEGWVRDFVWECDGWTRDGNPNTLFGRTVLPLPAHKLKDYHRPPGRLQDDPVYQRFPGDWKNYHTRYVTSDYFELGLRTFRRPTSGR